MKTLFTSFKILSIMLIALVSSFQNEVQANDNYTDFLPKYRKFKSHYQIDKIEYRDKRTIIFFRQIIQETGTVLFYGGSHSNSWYLRTPPRMKGLEIQFKMLEMRDIRINNQQTIETLTHLPEIDQEVKRGDVITCELHFVRIPQYIRMVDMIEGENGDLDEDRLNCFDIMVKGKDSPLLGAPENSDAISKRFDQSFNYTQPKIETPNTPHNKIASAEKEAQRAKYKNLLSEQDNSKPINYMPSPLRTVADIKCQERVILPDVNFRDNELSFSGRVKAIDNIKIIYNYLIAYPQAIVRLHGHTDIMGDEYKNLELSKERAMAVKRELVIMGIDYERIEIFFYGGKQPLQEFQNGDDRNRRVEVEAICTPNTAVVPKGNVNPTPKPEPKTDGPQISVKDKTN
jgi:outer membrane protein OmpA-like peptidoglycan-associated protein